MPSIEHRTRKYRADLADLYRRRLSEGDRTRLRKDLYQQYIDEILPDLIKPHEPVPTLVQLVGFAVEPLLIAAGTFRPHVLILILNPSYGEIDGAVMAREVVGLIRLAAERLELSDLKIIEKVARPSRTRHLAHVPPDAVFLAIHEALAEERPQREPVVIDITGAKKSMVAGAYQYATFSPRARVTYVDFEGYDRELNRPLDETCYLVPLTDPYDDFALRDANRLAQFYESFSFQVAGRILRDVSEKLRDLDDSLSREMQQGLEDLGMALEVFTKWWISDFEAARDLAERTRSRIQIPAPVKALGKKGSDLTDPSKACFRLRHELVISDLLISHRQDFHAAVLRSFGVHEQLLKLRVEFILSADGFVLEGRRLGECPSEMRRTASRELQGAEAARLQRLLGFYKTSEGSGSSTSGDGGQDFKCLRLDGKPKILLADSHHSVGKFWNRSFAAARFKDLRNSCAHKNHFPTRAEAEQAVRFAAEDLNEFLNRPHPKSRVSLPPEEDFLPPKTFQELCSQVGFTFFSGLGY